MVTLLTDRQIEELVKAGAAAIAEYHGGEDNEDDEAHVRLALTAALPAIERAVLERLSDPLFVRLNILSGGIARPDDLVWLHDTNGPVAAKVREAERAVLERAAARVEDGIAVARKIGGPLSLIEIHTRKEAASDIRALAGEVG